MEQQTNNVFISNFSPVRNTLILFALFIAFPTMSFGSEDADRAAVLERIRPVADVYLSEADMAPAKEAAVEEPAPPAAPAEEAPVEAAPAQAAAPGGGQDAETIYNSVCMACHTTGVLEAPKPGSPEMAQRAEKGIDAMVEVAVNGLNAMPPRGGRADLSDEQIKAVVEFMLK